MKLFVLLAALSLHAQPKLAFVQTAAGVDLRITSAAAASAIQVRFAVPADAVITAGTAVAAPKSLYQATAAGAATVIIAGGNTPLIDGTLASIVFTPQPWPFSAVDPVAAAPDGTSINGVTVTGVAFAPPQPAVYVPALQRDSWKLAAPGYRLTYPVYGGEKNALVFLNGLLQTQGADYQLVGTLLQFSIDLFSLSEQRVSVVYWH